MVAVNTAKTFWWGLVSFLNILGNNLVQLIGIVLEREDSFGTLLSSGIFNDKFRIATKFILSICSNYFFPATTGANAPINIQVLSNTSEVRKIESFSVVLLLNFFLSLNSLFRSASAESSIVRLRLPMFSCHLPKSCSKHGDFKHPC